MGTNGAEIISGGVQTLLATRKTILAFSMS